MSSFGQELLESAQEALDIAEGKVSPARIHAPDQIDVAALRKRLKLSQAGFAERFHFSVATVRDWEQKRRVPDRIANSLLRVIEHAPETVVRALNEKAA